MLLRHSSRVRLCVTPYTSAHQALLPLGFSRQEHWSGLPFPSPMHESEKVKVKSLSHDRLLATPWTAAYQAPPSMGFSRQEYWSGVPLPSPLLCQVHIISVLYCAHLCMKCSLDISNLLEELSSLSHSIVFLYFFALITEEGFLISPCY